MRDRVEKWLREVFSEEITVRRADIKGGLNSPKGDYDLWLVEGLAASFVLITPRPGVGNPSVLGVAELVHRVREHSVRFVAYGTGALSAVERKRLLVRHVPFVVAGRQVFLPFLGIALRADPAALSRGCLGRTAQRFMLAYLDGHTGVFDRQFVYRKMNCAPASVFRAYNELEFFGLIDRTPRGIVFRPDSRRTFQRLAPRLKHSPVRAALLAAIYGDEQSGFRTVRACCQQESQE